MGKFEKGFTTQEKKSADSLKPQDEQTNEAGKMELSNDAFAIGRLLSELLDEIRKIRTKQ